MTHPHLSRPARWADLVSQGFAPLVDLVADVGEVRAAPGETLRAGVVVDVDPASRPWSTAP